MKNLRINLMMAVLAIFISNSCASQTYLQTPLSQKRLRFSEQGFLYWETCKKEKSILGKIFSKENCKDWHREKFTSDDFKKLKELNFRCMSVDTWEKWLEKILDYLVKLAPVLIIGIYFGKIEMRISNLEKKKENCHDSKCGK